MDTACDCAGCACTVMEVLYRSWISKELSLDGLRGHNSPAPSPMTYYSTRLEGPARQIDSHVRKDSGSRSTEKTGSTVALQDCAIAQTLHCMPVNGFVRDQDA